MESQSRIHESGARSLNKAPLARAENLAARGAIYGCLSSLYGPPNETFLDRGSVASLGPALRRCGLSSLRPELRELEDYLKGLGEINILSAEYVRLFRTPGERRVYPYASMFIDGGIMGPSTMAVIDFYRDGGLSLAESFKDLPDHISAEFEFMYFLCVMGLQTLHQGEAVARQHFQRLKNSFLVEHLANWIPKFAEAILRNTSSPFYRPLAVITREFLHRELLRAT